MAEFSERLAEAIKIRHMKYTDITDRCGISKGTIANYIAGKYEAKQNNLYKLARALDVSEAWLMGYDVPMERTTIFSTPVDTDEKDMLYSRYLAADDKTKTIIRMMLGMD